MRFFDFLHRTYLAFLAIVIVIIFVLWVFSYIFQKPSPPAPEIIFDIPALVGKNIDETRAILGKSDGGNSEPKDTSNSQWDDLYTKNNFRLYINFIPKTREIRQFLIVSQDNSGYDWYAPMLKIGNLDSCSANYTTDFDKSWDDDYTNVTIHPIHPEILFDIPNLITKNMDEIRLILSNDLAANHEYVLDDKSIKDKFESITREGYILLISFNPKTKKVTLMQINTDKCGGMNQKDMLKIGNLKSETKFYSTFFDSTETSNQVFNSVTIYPK